LPGRRAPLRALTRGPEPAEELHGIRHRRTEPVRHARVELGGLTRLQVQVVLAEHQPRPAAQDVEPFIALVRLRGSGPARCAAATTARASGLRQLSDDVTFFTHGTELSEEDRTRLAARGIRVVDGPVGSVETVDDHLAGVRLADGTSVPLQALAVATRMVARAGFLGGLGLRTVADPSGAGEHLPTDPAGRTQVPGVWAAGTVTDPDAQVGAAAAAGAFAGAQINADLVEQETQAAVAALTAEPAPLR
jgi:hypothetical protein